MRENIKSCVLALWFLRESAEAYIAEIEAIRDDEDKLSAFIREKEEAVKKIKCVSVYLPPALYIF